ncbi:MAG: phosphoglycerate kinase [Alphaproteobacteria bacterium]|nr:phosphoglycerate kinase [Alphaproteobacteria bacterium]
MARYRTIDQAEVKGRRVLVRADLNVPMKDGRVADATRIVRFAPTVKDLAAKGARVVVLSHFDRPKGKRVPSMSLSPIGPELAKATGLHVAFADDCIGDVATTAVGGLKDGQVLLLENLRYHNGEQANDTGFIKQLAALGDVYVNDAFSAAHRAHASTEGLAHVLPAFAGRQMEAELGALSAALDSPKHPVMAIVGGSKISTKIDVLTNLLGKVQVLAIGGAMANTFLHAQGISVGKSLCESGLAETAKDILAKAVVANCEIVLPHDAVIADGLKPGVSTALCNVSDIPADQMMLDIGPASVATLKQRLAGCKTLLWNGPVGAFETPPFDQGTLELARTAAHLTAEHRLVSVAGGGDTVAALNAAGVGDKLTYVSTAGGAFLEWLEGKELPGVKALSRG